MVSSVYKPLINRFIEPIARVAVRAGITPNVVTIVGTTGSIASAIYFYLDGRLVIGTILISIFALSDLFDGAIARVSKAGPSAWGGFLDSTCDRLTDSAILGSLAIYSLRSENPLTPVILVAIVFGSLVPYIRAKAESYGIPCTVGIAERTERLVIALVAIGFHGLGVPYILTSGIWLLLTLSVVTVIQRVMVVRTGLSKNV